MTNRSFSEVNFKSLESLSNARNLVSKQVFKVPYVLFICIGLVISLIGIYFGKFIGIFPFVLGMGFIELKVSRYKDKMWENFALDNDWQLERYIVDDPLYIPPGIYGIGHTPLIGDAVVANFEGYDCRMYTFKFITGDNEYTTEQHVYTIVRVVLERSFPHLVLDSKRSYGLKVLRQATTLVKLEGNFNEEYNLYFEKNGQVDALSVITPDVMQAILSIETKMDIEIIDKYLYFMFPSDARDAKNVKKFLGAASKIMAEVGHKAKTINYAAKLADQDRAFPDSGNKQLRGVRAYINRIPWQLILLLSLPLQILIFVRIIYFIIENT